MLLNLEPDHLDRHGSFEAYRDAKLRIFERARAKIVPRGSGLDGIEFAADDPLPAEPLIPGAHNRENAAAATAAARAAGDRRRRDRRGAAHVRRRAAPARARARAARRPLRQRLEGDERRGCAPRRRGLRDAPLRLILGGSRKGEDFAAVRARAARHRAFDLPDRRVGRRPRRALDAAGRTYERARRSRDARVATRSRDAEPGDVVLLSPASASYDQFDDFEHRGETFRRLVEELA